MLLEPALGLSKAGAEPFDLAPEAWGVVHLSEMSEFVEDDVIADEGWGLEEAPIEGERAAPGTRAPAGTLVADTDALNHQTMHGGEFEDSRRQFADSQSPKMPFQGGP